MANNLNDYSLNCLTDPQIQLSNALSKGNIREFRIVLDMGAEATVMDQRHTNIYEKALQTYGCGEFVAECLKRGCSPNHINTHYNKAAINYACESLDPQIIQCLLNYPNIQVNRKYSQLTPLNYLAKRLAPDNIRDVVQCIRILLEYGTSPNIPDQREMTPLHYIINNRKIEKNQRNEIIQMFLQHPHLDIDTYRDGEVRKILEEEFPQFTNLPAPPTDNELNDSVPINLEILFSHIRSGNTDKFKKYFLQYLSKVTQNEEHNPSYHDEHYLPLLFEAIKCGCSSAFDMTIVRNVNINAMYDGNTAIEVAAICGNWYALQKLLDQPNFQLHKNNDYPLITIIRRWNEENLVEFCDYRKCFYILLESGKIDVNEQDKSGSTALHYAVKYRLNEPIIELLKRGAYIGLKSKFNDLPIDGISADILEKHFNNCITSNDLKMGDDSFEIYFNYMNLLPPIIESERNRRQQNTTKNSYEEMSPIAFLAKSKEHRYLLQHPLITSFLYLKWHRLSLIFYINFIIYIFFTISLITHTMLKFRESEYELLTTIVGMCSWCGIIYLIFRELMQLIMSPINYFKSFTNYMEILLIVLAVMTCSEPSYDKETQRIIAVFTMLLIAIELCLLVGSLPILSLSTHLLMLDAVLWSFLKSFTLYSIFVIAFSLCFYILFGKPEYNPGNHTNGFPVTNGDGINVTTMTLLNDGLNEADANNSNLNDNEDFNKFTNPLAALIKTIVMLTGEFDAGDLEFDSLFNYLLFLAFVFLMTMVLFNLLNGLAVSDTQTIKGQAELNGYICRTNLLTRYEEVLTSGHLTKSSTSFLLKHQPFRYLGERLINLYPHYIKVRKISVLPNESNKILIFVSNDMEKEWQDLKNMKELKDMNYRKNSLTTAFLPLSDSNETERQQKAQILPCCCNCFIDKCSQMDSRTIKLAIGVLEQKAIRQKNEKQLKSTEQRLQNLEMKLDRIIEILNRPDTGTTAQRQ